MCRQRGAASWHGPLLALFGCAFLLATSPAAAAPTLAKPKRTDGPAPMELSDGGVYSGETQGKNPHGVGRKVLPSGEEFEGEWLDGLLHGAGMHKSAAGLSPSPRCSSEPRSQGPFAIDEASL